MTSEEFHDALYRERCRREDVENDNRRRHAAILAQRRHFNDWQWCLIEIALLTPNAKVSRSAPLLAQVGSTDGLERIFTTETEHDTD